MQGLPRSARALWVAALFALAAAPLAAEEREILLAQSDAGAGDEELGEAELDAALEDSGGPPAWVEVLRVRGRGIAAIQTEVPASVTSFDAATIEALGAQDVSDLSRVTPNVSIVQPGATQANFFIRGIGLSDFSANSQGAVTIFQDDVAVNAPAIQTGQLFDIGGVDIVRGPQGFGPFRNASAGAIRVNSNLPSGNYGGMIRASLGQYWAENGKGARDALIQDYEGYVEAPLVEDLLSTRLAFRLRDTDPYKTNGCGNNIPFSSPPRLIRTSRQDTAGSICGERGQQAGEMFPIGDFSQVPKGLDREINYEDNWAARGFLRINPPETDLDIVLNAHGSRLDQDQAYGQAIGVRRVPRRGSPFGGTAVTGYPEPDQAAELERFCAGLNSCPRDILARFEKKLAEGRPLDSKPYRGDFNRDGMVMRDAYGGYARAQAKWNDLDIFFLASYDGYERDRDQDTDLVPDILFETAEEDESWQTYQELSIGGELAAAPFDWEFGGFYLREELESDSIISLFQGIFIARDYEQVTNSWGLWGQFKWDVLDDWTLEGGVRWNWERKDFEIGRETFGSVIEPRKFAEKDDTWSTPTGGLVLTYHFDERASAFAKYSRGFKAGHFNGVAGDNVDAPAADPEFNDAIEAGLQGAWLDGRLSMLTAFFYYRYKDYQVFLFRDQANAPPVLEIINAEEAENYGIEVEGRLEPLRGWVPRAIEGLMLTWNFSWLHGEFLDFAFTSTFASGRNELPFTVDFSGDQLLSSPEFKFSGSVAWTLDLGRYGYIIPRYDFNWSDDTFYGVNEGQGAGSPRGIPRLPEFAVGQEAYWLHNVRLTYRTPTTNVELAFWVRNIEDTVYKSFAFDASNFSGVVLNFVGEPRTWGGDITFRFP
ncbi:MAG: TonB-dependent receptor [Myxococcota bacterium]